MSSQYLNSTTFSKDINIKCNDIDIRNDLTVGNATAVNYFTLNQYFYKAGINTTQLTSPTTSVSANYKSRIMITTQIFTTPHSNNNITSFNVTEIDASGDDVIVNANIQRYTGTTGLPIIAGVCLDNNIYKVNILNAHHNENLNGAIKISLEVSYMVF